MLAATGGRSLGNTVNTGPAIVHAGLTQNELDQQYDQRTLVPHVADYVARWRARSADLRATLPHTTQAYGPAAEERLDLFPGPAAGGAVHLHIHGGAWRSLSRGEVSFVLDGLGTLGQPVAVAGFGLAPATRLPGIVAQVRRAFLWLRHRFDRVSVSGHSSGAHLAACLLDGTWWRDAGLGAADFGPVLLASGPYDLEPVRLSARNAYLHLTRDEADALSPARRLADSLPPVAVVCGDGELAEFRRQAAAMGNALRARRADARVETLAGHNHFDVYDAFARPGGPICALLAALAERPTDQPQDRETNQ